jgi:hypothetical protein
MKILIAIKHGIIQSSKSWKAVLLIWFTLFLLVSLISFPIRGMISSGFGSSMIVERLEKGIDLEIISDLLGQESGILPAIGHGVVIMFIVSFFVNAFFNGGLFYNVSPYFKHFSFSGFWIACSRNFWRFIIIDLVMSFFILFITVVIFSAPLLMLELETDKTDKNVIQILYLAVFIYMILMPVLLLAADYARAWQVNQGKNRWFTSIGFGFVQCFRTLVSSWLTMFVILVIQGLCWFLILRVIPAMAPSTTGELLLLFVVSQALIVLKVYLKIFRYGCVSSLMSDHTGPALKSYVSN